MKYTGMELLRQLSLAFGPSGCEDAVRNMIMEQIEGECDGYCVDRVGNLIARVSGRGMDYRPEAPRRLMLCAHMDEVGFMISHITEEGYLKFGNVGGIDPRVLCGRPVTIGDERGQIPGVIATKAIHLQTKEERGKVTPVTQLYMDIGAVDRKDAEAHVGIGDYATFASDFEIFGKDGTRMKGKALDDRAGCAAMIEMMRILHADASDRPFDVYFAFTRCEEIGITGAAVAAHTVAPDWAIVLESTAINDVPGAVGSARVAEIGDGVAVSLVDNSTMYDHGMVRLALDTGAEQGIACQVKKRVSGGNDARVIQRSLDGVRVLALSLPTRYIHSASCVAAVSDYETMKALPLAMIRAWDRL